MPRELYDDPIDDEVFESEINHEFDEFDADDFFVDESEFPYLFENQNTFRAADL